MMAGTTEAEALRRSPAVATTSVAEFLRLYDRRGYRAQVGMGARPAVLVIDFAIAFTQGTPNFPGGGYDAEVASARRLLDAARGGAADGGSEGQRSAPVLFTTIAYTPGMQDAGLWAQKIPWIRGLQQGTREVEIDPALAPRADEPVLVKKYPSAFFGTDLHARLQRDGVDTLIIAGCTTSTCVRATTVDAMQHGYRALLAEEALGDFDPILHAVHLADLGARYADVVGVDALAAALAARPR